MVAVQYRWATNTDRYSVAHAVGDRGYASISLKRQKVGTGRTCNTENYGVEKSNEFHIIHSVLKRGFMIWYVPYYSRGWQVWNLNNRLVTKRSFWKSTQQLPKDANLRDYLSSRKSHQGNLTSIKRSPQNQQARVSTSNSIFVETFVVQFRRILR